MVQKQGAYLQLESRGSMLVTAEGQRWKPGSYDESTLLENKKKTHKKTPNNPSVEHL